MTTVSTEPASTHPGPGISQTIVQLYRQLQHQGFSADELQQVASVYGYMTELCGNRYRATGKPFMDHLVGVAGITAVYRPEITLVLAALAHSVYDEADFGTFWPTITRGSRIELRNRLGDDVDQLARLYSDLEWTLESATALPQRLTAMSAREQDVVFLRIANELEEAVNLDLLFYSEARRQKKLALLQDRPGAEEADPRDHALSDPGGVDPE